MAIHKHSFEKSKGLLAEIVVHRTTDESLGYYRSLSLENFINQFVESYHGIEFVDCAESFDKNSKILDIGVGAGQTSIYLAKQGHQVTAVEPSPDLCETIELMAKKENVEIAIHECSAEAISFANEFDVCIFNASLHHADDPLLCVQKCYNALKDNGKLFLINEQVLRFYKSKAAYYRSLANNPQKMGHYGGNEHIYRLPEYRTLLKKASFCPIVDKIPKYYLFPKIMLRYFVNYKSKEEYEYPFGYLVLKAIYYYVLSVLLQFRFPCFLAKELSFINITLIGVKSVRNK